MNKSLLALGLLGQASAWWGTGHLMVNRVAYESLLKENPAVLAKANAILDTLRDADPTLVKGESKHSFVECATWADDIKGRGGTFQSSWHFKDQPFLDEGGTLDDF